MTNFARHLYDTAPPARDTADGGMMRTINAYTLQMLVAGGFAATGFSLFFVAPNYGLGILFWFAGIVFGAHFSDKTYDRIRYGPG